MELAAAICTIQQPGEQPLPRCFCGAALIFAQLLHSVPLCLRNDCLLCIRYDEHILRIIGNPLFQLVGLGVGFEVTGAAGVFLPFQNPDDGLILPSIRILGQQLSLAVGIQSLGCENLIPFKNPGNLLRTFAVDAEVKDALDNRRGFLVQNPLVLCKAVRKRDLSYLSFFLHHFERHLNGVIYRFLTRSGYERYDPARFLDYKLEVLQMLLFCRMMGEAGSFASLAEYRRVRQIGAIYNNSGKSRAEVVSEFATQSGYKDESGSADELLTIARRNRSIVSLPHGAGRGRRRNRRGCDARR